MPREAKVRAGEAQDLRIRGESPGDTIWERCRAEECRLLGTSGSVLQAQDYLLQVAIPNVYFHTMAAYAILRHNGVDVGKMDFLGPIDWTMA
jgi:hypothetical protein